MSAITHIFRFSGAGEDFGPRADGIFIPHSIENSGGRYTIADALIVARWQDRPDVAGSYNRIVCSDGILSTVPDDHASGGVNPSSAYFKPRPWLYDLLPAEEVNNPNYFGQNVAVMGQVAVFNRDGWPAWAIDGLARCIIDEEQRIGRGVVVADHDSFQTNRDDIGPAAMQLVMDRYAELTAEAQLPDTAAPAPEIIVDFAATTHQIPKIVRIRDGASLFKQPVGADLHWTVPVGGAFDAELLLGYGNRFLARRRGQGSAFWIDLAAIDRAVPYVLATYGSTGLTQADADRQVEAAIAAFNKNLDVWASQRPTH